MKVFNDVSSLAAATLTAGQMVSVKEVGEYRIKASGSGITLANGNIAVPVASGTAVNVKQFGAVGDNTTNDHAAFVAAFASGASTVYVPEGTYKLEGTTITIPDDTEFYGAGRYSTTLNFTPSSDVDCFQIGWYTTMRDMTIANQYGVAGNNGTIRLQSLTHPEIPTNVGGNNWTDAAIGGLSYKNVLRNLVVSGGQNYNIYGVNLAYTTIENVRAVLSRNTSGNLYIWGKGGTNMPESTTVKIIGGEFTASYLGPGISLENTTDVLMNGTIAEGNYSRGMLFQSCKRINLQSCYVENNFAIGAATGDGDIVATNSSNIQINSCLILGNNSNNAVAASSSTDCAILNTDYIVLGGATHTLSVDSGWVVSSNPLGIVEYGIHSGGRWVKYADGTATYSKRMTLASRDISTAQGSIFIQGTPETDTDFPAIFQSDGASGFDFSAHINVMYGTGGVSIWPCSNGASTVNNAIRYRLACSTTQTGINIPIQITMVGRWK